MWDHSDWNSSEDLTLCNNEELENAAARRLNQRKSTLHELYPVGCVPSRLLAEDNRSSQSLPDSDRSQRRPSRESFSHDDNNNGRETYSSRRKTFMFLSSTTSRINNQQKKLRRTTMTEFSIVPMKALSSGSGVTHQTSEPKETIDVRNVFKIEESPDPNPKSTDISAPQAPTPAVGVIPEIAVVTEPSSFSAPIIKRERESTGSPRPIRKRMSIIDFLKKKLVPNTNATIEKPRIKQHSDTLKVPV